MEFDAYGNKVKQGEDGSINVSAQGKDITMDKDGNVVVNLTHIKRIDIENVDKLNYYKKVTLDGVTTIDANFANDGHFRVQYTREGEILDFHGTHVMVGITRDNIVTLKAQD